MSLRNTIKISDETAIKLQNIKANGKTLCSIDYKYGSVWSQTISVYNSKMMGFIVLTGDDEGNFLSAVFIDMEVDDSSSITIIDEERAQMLIKSFS